MKRAFLDPYSDWLEMKENAGFANPWRHAVSCNCLFQCEDQQFAYTVDGVTVSDFYTHHFFDPVSESGVRYSYTGAVKGPRKILRGGLLEHSSMSPCEELNLKA